MQRNQESLSVKSFVGKFEIDHSQENLQYCLSLDKLTIVLKENDWINLKTNQIERNLFLKDWDRNGLRRTEIKTIKFAGVDLNSLAVNYSQVAIKIYNFRGKILPIIFFGFKTKFYYIIEYYRPILN